MLIIVEFGLVYHRYPSPVPWLVAFERVQQSVRGLSFRPLVQ